jgi:hypothetical protein
MLPFHYIYGNTPSLNDQIRPYLYEGNERQWRSACGRIAILVKHDPIGYPYLLLTDPKVCCFEGPTRYLTHKMKVWAHEFESAVDEYVDGKRSNRKLQYRLAVSGLLDDAYRRICSTPIKTRPSRYMPGTGLDSKYDWLVYSQQVIEKVFSDLGMRKQK